MSSAAKPTLRGTAVDGKGNWARPGPLCPSGVCVKAVQGGVAALLFGQLLQGIVPLPVNI